VGFARYYAPDGTFESIIHIIACYSAFMRKNLSKSEHVRQQHDVELFIAASHLRHCIGPNCNKRKHIKNDCRPAQTEFRWVKGHDESNYGNSRADALADEGREQDVPVEMDSEEWLDGHPAIQDGARLQALEAKHTYSAIVRWHTKKIKRILHQDTLNEAKDKIQGATGLRPTNEKLLKGIKALEIPPRIKDHMRTMLTGKIKCGAFWAKIPGHNEKAFCPFCKKRRNIEIVETEQHLWLECENSGQAQAWNTTRELWHKSTTRDWPDTNLGLIRGTAALTFDHDMNKDSERLRILISMTVWAIWKSKIKISIQNQDVTPNETTQILKGLLTDLLTKSWNATRFMEEDRKLKKQKKLRKLWAEKKLTKFDPLAGPQINFT